MLHLEVIIYTKLTVKVSVYFVTSMFSFILNIVSKKPKHKNDNRKIDFDTFYLQEIKTVGQSFNILTNFIFTFYQIHCHLFVISHYIWQFSEIYNIQYFEVKIVHNATLIICYL